MLADSAKNIRRQHAARFFESCGLPGWINSEAEIFTRGLLSNCPGESSEIIRGELVSVYCRFKEWRSQVLHNRNDAIEAVFRNEGFQETAILGRARNAHIIAYLVNFREWLVAANPEHSKLGWCIAPSKSETGNEAVSGPKPRHYQPSELDADLHLLQQFKISQLHEQKLKQQEAVLGGHSGPDRRLSRFEDLALNWLERSGENFIGEIKLRGTTVQRRIAWSRDITEKARKVYLSKPSNAALPRATKGRHRKG